MTAQSGLSWAPPKGGPRSGARPGGKDLPGKNHEEASPSRNRRAQRQYQTLGCIPGRGDPAGRPLARRFPRKSSGACGKRARPPDAFCPEGPCPRAPTQASRKWQAHPLNQASSSLPVVTSGEHGWNKNEERPGQAIKRSSASGPCRETAESGSATLPQRG